MKKEKEKKDFDKIYDENFEKLENALYIMENAKPKYSNWLFKCMCKLDIHCVKFTLVYKTECDRGAHFINLLVLSIVVILNSILISYILYSILKFFHILFYER